MVELREQETLEQLWILSNAKHLFVKYNSTLKVKTLVPRTCLQWSEGH